MKKNSCILFFVALCTISFAQEQPLQDAIDIIRHTKGYLSLGNSSESLRDSKDSLCTISITDFQIQAKSDARICKMLSQMLACYDSEAAGATSSHSYVIQSDSSSLPGYKTVRLFYGEGKAPYTSEKGHSYISVRNDIDTGGYRLATCIEWWKDGAGSFLGRIVEVKGPFSKDVYKSGKQGKVIQTPPSSPTWYKDALHEVSEIHELANMWKETGDADRRTALEESINERYRTVLNLSGFHEADSVNVILVRMLRAMSGVSTYKSKVKLDVALSRGHHQIEEWDIPLAKLADGLPYMDIENIHLNFGERQFYVSTRLNKLDDSGPELKVPRKSVDAQVPTYTAFQTSSQTTEEGNDYDNIAAWSTAENTYIVRTYYIPDNEATMTQNPACYIRDSRTGEIYDKTGNVGISGETEFMVEGCAGERIAIVEIYPAIPLSCTRIDIEPAFAVKGHEEDSRRLRNMSVEVLQAGQSAITEN